MLGRLARFAIRRRTPILVVAAGFIVAAGALGGGVAKYLSSGGFNDPNSQSSRAEDRLPAVFHTSEPNLILLVSARHGEVNDPAVAAAGGALTSRLAAEPDMGRVVSYWSLGRPPPLASRNGTQGLILGVIPGSDDHVHDVVTRLSPKYTGV